MHKGEPASGIEFFRLLHEDQDFCAELGRAVLAAGRLEAELNLYLSVTSVIHKDKRATLGKLLGVMKKEGTLKQMQPAIAMLKDQRNYLTHNIYGLFSGLIEESILPQSDLLDSDVDVFTDRAWQLAENLNGLADIVAKANSTHNKALQTTPLRGAAEC
ncbi:MAG: hypothetical protein WAW61_01635 [Methylococcaceae bacterium]